MAAFDPEVEVTQPEDYRLVANTFVTLFRRRDVLCRTTDMLEGKGYDIARVHAAGWTSEDDLHRDLAAALSFPAHYGRNLNALNDCLSDVASKEYGTAPHAAGLALVFERYDAFAASNPGPAHAVLDIFARQARNGALVGHRMMCLVQSDDPDITFPEVGATPVMWNDAEWLDTSRRPN